MKPIQFAVLAAAFMFVSEALAQPYEPTATYAAGFRLIEGEDAARRIGGRGGSATRARPIRAYVWFPARSASRPITFGRYATLADDDIWPAEIAAGLRENLKFSRGPVARSLEPAAFDALMRKPMLAAENGRPLPGPFPLIAVSPGLYYESPIVFAATAEYLAERGFVVVAVPLVGTHTALVKLDVPDLESEVRDLEVGISLARDLPFVSRDQLGVLGFDNGGMVGTILTMRNRDVDAFMSLDSGILFEHSSGLPRRAPDYDPFALRVPWFHATSVPAAAAPGASDTESLVAAAQRDPASLFVAAEHSDRFLLVTEGLGHVDFTSYALIEGRGAAMGTWGAASPTRAEGHKAVRRYTASFFAAFLAQDADSRAFLSRVPENSIPGFKMTLVHRAATPAAITYDEVVEDVVAGRGEEAMRELRSTAAIEPNHFLLQQTNLERLVVSLLFTYGLADQTIPVIEFLGERYPAAASAPTLLAEAHVLAGRYGDAIAVLEHYVEQHPDNAGARGRLEALRNR